MSKKQPETSLEAYRSLSELKKWIEEQKEGCTNGYINSKDEKQKTMYSSENMAYGLVICKIDVLIANLKNKQS